MGPLLILAIIAVLGWANAAMMRRLRSRTAAWGWWAAVLTLWTVGAIIGVWGGFFFEYQASPTLRVCGAPVPAAFFHLEGPTGEEQWIDFITPAPLLFAGANVVLMPLLLACPVGLVFWLHGRNRNRVAKFDQGK
jgi:hypothetical protein